MRLTTRLGSLAAIAASLSLVAGCAGGGSQIPATASMSHSSPISSLSAGRQLNISASRVPVVPGLRIASTVFHPTACGAALKFLSDATNAVIDIYTGKTMCNQIPASVGFSEPQGIAVDGSKNLWVANTGASNVLMFKPPYATVAKTLSDPGQYPAGVAICKGYIAVTNIITTGGGAGTVSIYKAGATSPSKTLSDPAASREYFPICDPSGNLFTSYMNASGTGAVNEWKLGGGTVKDLPIATGFPGGLDWESEHSTLWVGDQTFGAPSITEYPSPYTKAGHKITLGSGSNSDIVTFEVAPSDTQILGADAGNLNGALFALSGKEGGTLTVPNGGQPIGAAYNTDDK